MPRNYLSSFGQIENFWKFPQYFEIFLSFFQDMHCLHLYTNKRPRRASPLQNDKINAKNLFLLRFFVKCSKYAKLHSKLWIKGSSLKEVPWNSLFSSSRQKNGIRSINRRYTLLPSLGVQLSGEVPFVISEWLVWELPPDNQRVSNSLFERSPIIIVVDIWMLSFWQYLSFSYRFWPFQS